jgi:hypothetical protein
VLLEVIDDVVGPGPLGLKILSDGFGETGLREEVKAVGGLGVETP